MSNTDEDVLIRKIYQWFVMRALAKIFTKGAHFALGTEIV